MPLEYSSEVIGDIYKVNVQGHCENLEEFALYTENVLRMVEEAGRNKIIIDITKVETRFGILDNYESGMIVADTAPPKLFIAVIDLEENLQDAKFWENVTVNRGVKTKVYSSVDEAKAWLS